jgi:hypothetical protein
MSVSQAITTGEITLDATSLSGCSAGDLLLLRITRTDANAGELQFRQLGLKYRESL